MKKTAKIIGLAGLFLLMGKACNVEYNQDVIAHMPTSTYESITEAHPDYSDAEIVEAYEKLLEENETSGN